MAVVGAEDEEYTLTADDIDSSLVFMYTPVTEEGARGEPQYAMTDFIKAGGCLHNFFWDAYMYESYLRCEHKHNIHGCMVS